MDLFRNFQNNQVHHVYSDGECDALCLQSTLHSLLAPMQRKMSSIFIFNQQPAELFMVFALVSGQIVIELDWLKQNPVTIIVGYSSNHSTQTAPFVLKSAGIPLSGAQQSAYALLFTHHYSLISIFCRSFRFKYKLERPKFHSQPYLLIRGSFARLIDTCERIVWRNDELQLHCRLTTADFLLMIIISLFMHKFMTDCIVKPLLSSICRYSLKVAHMCLHRWASS